MSAIPLYTISTLPLYTTYTKQKKTLKNTQTSIKQN